MERNPGRILVTGGTGTLGRLVVRRLVNAGHVVRILSRQARQDDADVEYVVGDLQTGQGVDVAVAGVGTIVHCAGSTKGDQDKARNLVRAASGAGVTHLVFISVVGADRIPVSSWLDRMMFGYFESKSAAEEIVAGSGIAFSTLRATQFHDLVLLAVRQMAKLPVVPAPAGFRLQPVDADVVAARLTQLTLGEPAGLVSDLGGPRIYQFSELMRDYLRTIDRRRLIVSMPLPGKAAGAFRAGANLTPEHAAGGRSWADFLADRLAAPSDPVAS